MQLRLAKERNPTITQILPKVCCVPRICTGTALSRDSTHSGHICCSPFHLCIGQDSDHGYQICIGTDWAHPSRICIAFGPPLEATPAPGPTPATSASQLGPPLPSLHRKCCHICTGTGPTSTHTAGHGDWAHPLPHLRRDQLTPLSNPAAQIRLECAGCFALALIVA
jgi:hypothetical protein